MGCIRPFKVALCTISDGAALVSGRREVSDAAVAKIHEDLSVWRETGYAGRMVVECFHSGSKTVNVMGTLVIKNLPEQLHDKLRRQAERNHRSLNKEAMVVLEQALGSRPAPKLSPPLKLRGGFRPTIEEILAAIEDGRYSHYRSLDEVNEWVDELRQDRDVAP